MSPKRPPMAPPELAGFTYLDLLGSGGFADVFLYEQHLPRRRVAVKVLLPERMTSGSVAEFTAEANVMAMLSTHPAIVTIHQASVADDGRPYLVMEYCPRPNLQVRYRREPFSVAEALRVGVQVASAVETAHRAGVLHRDIKPANVLVTEYNRPALTDFGIASTTTDATESEGMSIPWSPPESFADAPTADPRSDVYALGATVYTLLAGRAPFELPGERNTSVDLIDRIERMPLPPIGRPDAPASLQHVLERSMAKSPLQRHESALAFARALQTVQIELAHSVTPIDILDDGPALQDEGDDGEELTRVRGVVSISPETSPAAGLTRPSRSFEPPQDTTSSFDVTETLVRPPRGPGVGRPRPSAPPVYEPAQAAPVAPPTAPPAAPSVDPAWPSAPSAAPAPAWPPLAPGVPQPTSADPGRLPRERRRVLPWVLTGVGLLLIGAIIVVVSLLGGSAPDPEPTTAEPVDPQNPAGAIVPRATDLVGTPTSDGQVAFTWTNPDPQDGDYYLWNVVDASDANPVVERADAASVTVPAVGAETCIEVVLVRENGRASSPERACSP